LILCSIASVIGRPACLDGSAVYSRRRSELGLVQLRSLWGGSSRHCGDQ